jgi:cytochrome c peroxidase
MNSRIRFSRAFVVANEPRRNARRTRMLNQHSIWFSHEQCLGVYTNRTPCATSTRNARRVSTFARIPHAGSYPEIAQGLFDVTLRANDCGRFRPPSLRNVALTAPYMHDGGLPTLRDVLRHHAPAGPSSSPGPAPAADGRAR